MKLTQYREARAFYRRAEPFLIRHEADHNLLLGICDGLVRHPEQVEREPFLAMIESGDYVVAASIMTPPHNLILSRAEASESLSLIADCLRRQYPQLPGVLGPESVAQAFATIWCRLTAQLCQRTMGLRIFQLEAVTPVSGVPGMLRRATAAHRALLVEWFAAFGEEASAFADHAEAERAVDNRLASEGGGIHIWCDKQDVCVVGHGGPTPNGIRVGPVYTPPPFRRRGYASAAVAAVSQHLLNSGRRFCFLFTDRDNPTSNHIYQAIGYQPVCNVDEFAFRSASDVSTAGWSATP